MPFFISALGENESCVSSTLFLPKNITEKQEQTLLMLNKNHRRRTLNGSTDSEEDSRCLLEQDSCHRQQKEQHRNTRDEPSGEDTDGLDEDCTVRKTQRKNLTLKPLTTHSQKPHKKNPEFKNNNALGTQHRKHLRKQKRLKEHKRKDKKIENDIQINGERCIVSLTNSRLLSRIRLPEEVQLNECKHLLPVILQYVLSILCHERIQDSSPVYLKAMILFYYVL